jgi:hypothetical protein
MVTVGYLRIPFASFIRNIARALLIVFPLLLGSIWVVARRLGDAGDDWVLGGLYYLLTLGIPIVLGAATHQLLLLLIGRARAARGHLRLIALVLVLVFPLAFLLVGSQLGLVVYPPLLLPLLIGGALYALTMRIG